MLANSDGGSNTLFLKYLIASYIDKSIYSNFNYVYSFALIYHLKLNGCLSVTPDQKRLVMVQKYPLNNLERFLTFPNCLLYNLRI